MPVDLVLLDLDLPEAQGVDPLEQARAHYPGVPVLVFSGRKGPGAAVIEALRSVLTGIVRLPAGPGVPVDAAPKLTPQQLRVLKMLCAGLSNKQIGVRLDVTEATVKAHMRAIMEKFGASNRTQVVLAAQRLALDRPDYRERASSTPPSAIANPMNCSGSSVS
jgi:DNA-binding NarL/FixJ family response regulator